MLFGFQRPSDSRRDFVFIQLRGRGFYSKPTSLVKNRDSPSAPAFLSPIRSSFASAFGVEGCLLYLNNPSLSIVFFLTLDSNSFARSPPSWPLLLSSGVWFLTSSTPRRQAFFLPLLTTLNQLTMPLANSRQLALLEASTALLPGGAAYSCLTPRPSSPSASSNLSSLPGYFGSVFCSAPPLRNSSCRLPPSTPAETTKGITASVPPSLAPPEGGSARRDSLLLRSLIQLQRARQRLLVTGFPRSTCPPSGGPWCEGRALSAISSEHASPFLLRLFAAARLPCFRAFKRPLQLLKAGLESTYDSPRLISAEFPPSSSAELAALF